MAKFEQLVNGVPTDMRRRSELSGLPVPSLPLVSVDDHVLEPPTTFSGRMPNRFVAQAPRIERGPDGADYWRFEDKGVAINSGDAMVTWDDEHNHHLGPTSFDDVRPATWDIHERIRDMDAAGIAASLNFPSGVFGFCGHRFFRFEDKALGLASLRAYNQWTIEEWAGAYPDRIIPSQLGWLLDPQIAAEDVYRNSELGFKAISFSENPERLGLNLPSIHTDFWDPLFRACEETETVINLHVGSSSETVVPSTDSPLEVVGALFAVNGLIACADWACSRVPLAFPGLKIVMSEGGIGWVPMLVDRLRYLERRPPGAGGLKGRADVSPLDVIRQNFWFTTFDDPSAMALRHEIGVDRIMFESDYPHPDTSWPHTQDEMSRVLAPLTDAEVERIAFRNACDVYRHPLPDLRRES